MRDDRQKLTLNNEVYDNHTFINPIIQLVLHLDRLLPLHRPPRLVEIIQPLNNYHLLNILVDENNFSIESLLFVLKQRQPFGLNKHFPEEDWIGQFIKKEQEHDSIQLLLKMIDSGNQEVSEG